MNSQQASASAILSEVAYRLPVALRPSLFHGLNEDSQNLQLPIRPGIVEKKARALDDVAIENANAGLAPTDSQARGATNR
jgi:hypothetical protein